MDIGNLLQLQGPLERDRESCSRAPRYRKLDAYLYVRATSRISEFSSSTCSINFGRSRRDWMCRATSACGERAFLSTFQRNHGKYNDLRSKRLRRGHTDLRPSVEIDACIGFASDGGADDVADSQDQCPGLLGHAHGGQRVGSFSALRNRNHDILFVSESDFDI